MRVAPGVWLWVARCDCGDQFRSLRYDDILSFPEESGRVSRYGESAWTKDRLTMSAPFLNCRRLQECFAAINPTHVPDSQNELTFPMIASPRLGRSYGGAGVRSRSDNHLAVDLNWIENLKQDELADLGVRGTYGFGQPQFNVRRI
jgi:hypothetical protein